MMDFRQYYLNSKKSEIDLNESVLGNIAKAPKALAKGVGGALWNLDW